MGFENVFDSDLVDYSNGFERTDIIDAIKQFYAEYVNIMIIAMANVKEISMHKSHIIDTMAKLTNETIESIIEWKKKGSSKSDVVYKIYDSIEGKDKWDFPKFKDNIPVEDLMWWNIFDRVHSHFWNYGSRFYDDNNMYAFAHILSTHVDNGAKRAKHWLGLNYNDTSIYIKACPSYIINLDVDKGEAVKKFQEEWRGIGNIINKWLGTAY